MRAAGSHAAPPPSPNQPSPLAKHFLTPPNPYRPPRYVPLQYKMGNWSLEAGDALVCELWECDGGCDPARPLARPNATAGDDLIGTGTLLFSSFASGATQQVNMYRNGVETGNIQVECSACTFAAGFVNPYTRPSVAPVNGSFPAAGTPPPSPAPSPAPSRWGG